MWDITTCTPSPESTSSVGRSKAPALKITWFFSPKASTALATEAAPAPGVETLSRYKVVIVCASDTPGGVRPGVMVKNMGLGVAIIVLWGGRAGRGREAKSCQLPGFNNEGSPSSTLSAPSPCLASSVFTRAVGLHRISLI